MAYKTNEELMRELSRLKAQQSVKLDMAKREAERKALQKMVFAMKHEKSLKVAKGLGRGALTVGKGVGKALSDFNKQIAKHKQAQRKRR